MYIVNQNGDQTIELHSINYSCYWNEKYTEARKNIVKSLQYDIIPLSYETHLKTVTKVVDSWKQAHPYEEIVDIYVDGDQKFGTFYSRRRGIEEYENILKALEDGVILYRIPEINKSERENGK